jgi:hypothetical protein
MADATAFMPESQTEYAFPPGQSSDQDEADQTAARNQQIQAAFDAQRFQRNVIQNVAKTLSADRASIAKLQAQQKT